jgi:hypothetical protein
MQTNSFVHIHYSFHIINATSNVLLFRRQNVSIWLGQNIVVLNSTTEHPKLNTGREFTNKTNPKDFYFFIFIFIKIVCVNVTKYETDSFYLQDYLAIYATYGE